MVAQATRQARLPFLAPDRLRRAQERRVRATVVYAHAYVPYYRETMSKLALEPADFCSAGDLAQLPVIEREQLQRDPEYFLSEQWPAEACVVLHSGGSTGAPVTVFRDPESLFMEGCALRTAALRHRTTRRSALPLPGRTHPSPRQLDR